MYLVSKLASNVQWYNVVVVVVTPQVLQLHCIGKKPK